MSAAYHGSEHEQLYDIPSAAQPSVACTASDHFYGNLDSDGVFSQNSMLNLSFESSAYAGNGVLLNGVSTYAHDHRTLASVDCVFGETSMFDLPFESSAFGGASMSLNGVSTHTHDHHILASTAASNINAPTSVESLNVPMSAFSPAIDMTGYSDIYVGGEFTCEDEWIGFAKTSVNGCLHPKGESEDVALVGSAHDSREMPAGEDVHLVASGVDEEEKVRLLTGSGDEDYAGQLLASDSDDEDDENLLNSNGLSEEDIEQLDFMTKDGKRLYIVSKFCDMPLHP